MSLRHVGRGARGKHLQQTRYAGELFYLAKPIPKTSHVDVWRKKDDPRADTKYATPPSHFRSKADLKAATSFIDLHAVGLPDKVPSASSDAAT